MSFIIPLPGTDEPFTIETLAPALWYPIYCTKHHPAQAHTCHAGWGQSRFAPFKDAAGNHVHTWYAASPDHGTDISQRCVRPRWRSGR